jgi:hypothetical protein
METDTAPTSGNNTKAESEVKPELTALPDEKDDEQEDDEVKPDEVALPEDDDSFDNPGERNRQDIETTKPPEEPAKPEENVDSDVKEEVRPSTTKSEEDQPQFHEAEDGGVRADERMLIVYAVTNSVLFISFYSSLKILTSLSPVPKTRMMSIIFQVLRIFGSRMLT